MLKDQCMEYEEIPQYVLLQIPGKPAYSLPSLYANQCSFAINEIK